jgi:hypothetical protein
MQQETLQQHNTTGHMAATPFDKSQRWKAPLNKI